MAATWKSSQITSTYIVINDCDAVKPLAHCLAHSCVVKVLKAVVRDIETRGTR